MQYSGDLGAAFERVGGFGVNSHEPRTGIYFVDEIHRLNKTIEEILYPAMETENWILLSAKVRRHARFLDLPKFTLIGATSTIRERYRIRSRSFRRGTSAQFMRTKGSEKIIHHAFWV